MKRNLIAAMSCSLLIASFLTSAAPAAEQDFPFSQPQSAVVSAQGVPAEVLDRLATAWPRAPIDSVSPTPIQGLYEVTSNKNIMYFAYPSAHMIVGQIWSYLGENLTRNRQNEVMKTAFDTLDLSKGLVIGHGEKTVVEITDPDCLYCRKGAAWLDQRSDVKRIVFFSPIENLHPDAARKAAYILSSGDPDAAYRQVYSGVFDTDKGGKSLPAFEDNGKLLDQKQVVAKLGIQGTPAYFISGTLVSGANTEAMERLLGKAQSTANAPN